MRHATAEALDQLAPLLERLRAVEGLRERKPGNFTRGSAAFLHFHEDPTGLFADVKVSGSFERYRVTTTAEQDAFLGVVRRAVS